MYFFRAKLSTRPHRLSFHCSRQKCIMPPPPPPKKKPSALHLRVLYPENFVYTSSKLDASHLQSMSMVRVITSSIFLSCEPFLPLKNRFKLEFLSLSNYFNEEIFINISLHDYLFIICWIDRNVCQNCSQDFNRRSKCIVHSKMRPWSVARFPGK
jgi:hypothetical protein